MNYNLEKTLVELSFKMEGWWDAYDTLYKKRNDFLNDVHKYYSDFLIILSVCIALKIIFFELRTAGKYFDGLMQSTEYNRDKQTDRWKDG